MSLAPVIREHFDAQHVSPGEMDRLWARGWRHFGTEFFRYSIMEHAAGVQTVVPLRIELSQFAPSKSQRRVLRRNADLVTEFRPATLSGEARFLFHRHKQRFCDNVPDALSSFLSSNPATVPCECLELRCLLAGKLVAVSYLDLGVESVSSVYAIFEPSHSRRGLGIFTMLTEILWAKEQGRRYAYPGYATHGPSYYDYKKQFVGLQGYDWATEAWLPWARE